MVSGEFLENCMNSIFRSIYTDFEVIVNNSTENTKISDILSRYDVKVINKITRSLESRFLTVGGSSGDRIFLLDETRLITPTLLGKIADMDSKMIAIGEKEIGNGLITRLTNMDKKATMNASPEEISPILNKTVIPRVYDRQIMLASLNNIESKLPYEKIREVVGLDLEMIYLESWRQTKDLEFIKGCDIMHFGDMRYTSLFRKYYRYGKSQRMLRYTAYSNLAGIGGRTRKGLNFRDRMATVPLQILRGAPFLLGYIGGSD